MSTMVEPRIAVVIPPVSPSRKTIPDPLIVEWDAQLKRFALTLNGRRKHSTHLTATELHKAHGELRVVYPELDELYPKKLTPRTCSEATPICGNLRRYLKCVLDTCGSVLVAWVFFVAEEVPFAEYDVEVDRFQKTLLERELANCREELERILQSKGMLDNDSVYLLEDEVVTNLTLALGELFNYRISTFAEMKEFCDRHRHLPLAERGEHAQQAVNELTLLYHSECLQLVIGQRDRMKRDLKNEFDFWSPHHQNRYLKLCVFISQERLRLMLISRNLKRREYDRMILGNSPKKQDSSLIELKKDIYEHLLKILQEEERLLKKQKIIYERIASGVAKATDFGDALEDVDEMEVIYGKRKAFSAKELTSRLSAIYQRRAVLRNKVQSCANTLNKRLVRDSSASFTGRLSNDSSWCAELCTASEGSSETARKLTLVELQNHFRGTSSHLTQQTVSPVRSNGRAYNASETRLNVKAISLT